MVRFDTVEVSEVTTDVDAIQRKLMACPNFMLELSRPRGNRRTWFLVFWLSLTIVLGSLIISPIFLIGGASAVIAMSWVTRMQVITFDKDVGALVVHKRHLFSWIVRHEAIAISDIDRIIFIDDFEIVASIFESLVQKERIPSRPSARVVAILLRDGRDVVFEQSSPYREIAAFKECFDPACP
jgi:hypothetical protein